MQTARRTEDELPALRDVISRVVGAAPGRPPPPIYPSHSAHVELGGEGGGTGATFNLLKHTTHKET